MVTMSNESAANGTCSPVAWTVTADGSLVTELPEHCGAGIGRDHAMSELKARERARPSTQVEDPCRQTVCDPGPERLGVAGSGLGVYGRGTVEGGPVTAPGVLVHS